LPDSKLRDIANTIGARDLFRGHAIAQADAVEILTLFDMMDHTGPARTRSGASDARKRRTEHYEGEDDE
jgi:hypothetical protein